MDYLEIDNLYNIIMKSKYVQIQKIYLLNKKFKNLIDNMNNQLFFKIWLNNCNFKYPYSEFNLSYNQILNYKKEIKKELDNQKYLLSCQFNNCGEHNYW